MGYSIDQLLAEADDEIKGSLKTASQTEPPAQKDAGQPYGDDEPVKLAHFLEDFAESAGEEKQAQDQAPQRKEASAPVEEIEDTPIAKVAHALAVIETAMNIAEFKKMATFVKKAQEAGHSEDEINGFLEKQAKKVDQKTLMKGLAGLGLLGGTTYGAHELGEESGRKAGRKSGYTEGVRDTAQAYNRYYGGGRA